MLSYVSVYIVQTKCFANNNYTHTTNEQLMRQRLAIEYVAKKIEAIASMKCRRVFLICAT